MFFKRLSRSRSNSQSYVDNTYNSPHDSKTESTAYDDKYSVPERYQQQQQTDSTQAQIPRSQPQSIHQAEAAEQRPVSSRQNNTASQKEADMYTRPAQQQQQQQHEAAYDNTNAVAQPTSNGYSSTKDYSNSSAPATTTTTHHPPDLLLHAFNQALRPYHEKVEGLEGEIADLRAYIDQLEGHRSELHAWIDKRGLRPDVPPSIARQMDAASHDTSPTHAAATLNAQLDRKITIVNFDLHRLQDDLNDSLPTPSFSACMLKFLPDIERLSALSTGPRYAFDLLLKLGGNLNSHGGLENGDEEDLAERRSFYGRLDDSMVDVVRGRFREEGDGWGVQREIKRIEKTGAYLRNWGVEPYFPQTLEAMREGVSHASAGGAAEPPIYT